MYRAAFIFFLQISFFSWNLRASVKQPISSKNQSAVLKRELNKDFQKDKSLPHSAVVSEHSNKDYLIEKLNYLQKALPKNHKARKPLLLRKAHILHLRAEENFLKAEQESCKACRKTAQSDARKSLLIYRNMNSSIKSRHSFLYTDILFKSAHLHRLLKENVKSLFQLNQIVNRKKTPSSLMVKAWFNIGEIHFELYNYRQSLQAFNKVLKQGESPWKFRSIYRKVWSLFNLTLYEKSINELENFLKSDLYLKSSLSLEEKNLKKKLERELITLYSYVQPTKQRLDFLYNFSMQDSEKNTLTERNQRFFNLAQSLNKIGQFTYSNQVWEKYLLKSKDKENQLRAYSFMLDNDTHLNGNNLLQITGKKIENIFSLFQQTKVSKDFEQKLKKQFKAFIGAVNKKQALLSNDQKEYLLSLYQKYTSIYPNSPDIFSLSAYLAVKLKKYALAQDLFQRAVLSLDLSFDKKLKEQRREDMSFKQMEMAELTEDRTRRLQAYDFYIQHGNSEEQLFKAKYQKAYIDYENKNYSTAENSFTNLALYKFQNEKSEKLFGLRLKSAHLALSALDQMGNQEEALAQRARLFLKEFPQNRAEFLRIYHSALLNTLKKLFADRDFSHRPTQPSSDKDVLKAWEILKMISIKEAVEEEALTYYFNKLLLAKELLKFKEMDESFRFLLSNKKLKEEDRKIVLTWKLWLAELRFDFKEVLKIIKELQPDNQSEEHLLRLARLADLAGHSPVPYYKIFIKKFPNSQSLVNVLVSIVEKLPSHSERQTFLRTHSLFFQKQPDTLAYLVLKADQGKLNSQFISYFSSLSFMKGGFLDLFIRRKNIIESFEKEWSKLKDYSIPVRFSGYRLRKALKSYTDKINQLGDKAEKTLQIKDWTSRVFVISLWERELSRFYSAVMELPTPKGLTEEEQLEYKNLLKQQLRIYQEQITQLKDELKVLWSREVIADYRESFQQNKVFYSPLIWEMNKLLLVSKGEIKDQIKKLLSFFKLEEGSEKTVEKKDSQIQHLYKILKKNPFDKKSLAELLELEKGRNNKNLSYYLVNRIKEIKKTGGPGGKL